MIESIHPTADLALHLTGDLDAAAATRVESHLAECESCRRGLDELRGTLGALRAIDEAALPLPSALAEIGIPSAAALRRHRALPRLAAAAVLFAAGLLAGRALVPPPSAPPAPSPDAPEWSEDARVHRAHGLAQALLAIKASTEDGGGAPSAR